MSTVRAVLLNRLVIILSLIGVAIAGTLTVTHYRNVIPPCGLASGCESVLTGPSAKWFGIPVALFGLAAYLSILGIALFRVFQGLSKTRTLGLLGYWITLVGAMVSLGLQIYSGTVLKEWCSWCIGSAAVMTLLFIVQAVLYQAQVGEPDETMPRGGERGDFAFLGIAAILGIAAFVTTGMIANRGTTEQSFVVSDEIAPELVPEDAHMKGPVDAPITIVEFGDLCCPACQNAFALLNQVAKQYEGKVRVVFRHFPLLGRHPQSYRAAVYAEYAGTKGHFWTYLERVYQIPASQVDNKEVFENALLALNLNVGEAEKLYQDNESKEFERVYRDLSMADRLGIQVTPTFFIFAKGERPYSVPTSELKSTLESDRYKKLLGSGSG